MRPDNQETFNRFLVPIDGVIRDPALVLVDFQNSFCSPNHYEKLARDDATLEKIRQAVEYASDFAERYRQTGRSPIFLRTINEQSTQVNVQEDPDGKLSPPPCLPGSSEAQFVDGISPRDDDVVVTKPTYDGFRETGLHTLLSENGVSKLMIGGVNTHICVLSTAFSAINLGYDVLALSDCSAASSMEAHENGIDILSAVATDVRPSTDISLE